MIETATSQETRDDERILLVVHKHWAALVGDAAVFLFAGIVVCALLLVFRGITMTMADELTRAIVTFLVPIAFLVLWTVLALVWTNYYLDIFVVTDTRIFYTSQVNFVQRTVQQWRITDITRANVRFDSLIESFFNYGSLEIAARGEEDTTRITGIPDPQYVAAIISRQDDRFAELKETARKQGEMLHFLSHEVKGHLAKSKAAFAAIVEGDYGAVPEQLQSLAGEALKDSQKGVETVMNILQGPDAAHGSMQYDKMRFDLAEAVRRIFDELRPAAERKGIVMSISAGGPYIILGDARKIERHVIRNFIDNAIRYTFAGQIDISLAQEGGAVRFAVSDTGIGITVSDMQRLFTEGGRGEHSRTVNPDSTGYGLFIAKQVVEAHGGKVWARSSGPGSGSTFFSEFPLAPVQ